MAKLKILIATHKQYEFPKADYYLPIHVGKANNTLDLGIQADDFGENISNKNTSFCELTAIFWAWKHLKDEDYIGLVHYRRYFKGKQIRLKNKKIASETELLEDLKCCNVIASKQRNYYIESVYNHYKNAHFVKDLEATRKILEQDFPEYIPAFEKIMQGKKLHLFNMFVMSRAYFEQYCEWLFAILFKLEKQIDISGYDNYQKRVFGFLSERLFNVWLVKNQLKVKERKVVAVEGEQLIEKAIGLLKRKFLKKR